jgi:hypothetical protein
MKNDTIKEHNPIYEGNWRQGGFNQSLTRDQSKDNYIGGANFDAQLDEMLFNRMIKLKDLRVAPQGNEPGKIYWDGANNKYKLWINSTAGWADVNYTSTSTTTTSSSSSSSSTSTTSTSTTSTSSSSSSSSTSTSTS